MYVYICMYTYMYVAVYFAYFCFGKSRSSTISEHLAFPGTRFDAFSCFTLSCLTFFYVFTFYVFFFTIVNNLGTLGFPGRVFQFTFSCLKFFFLCFFVSFVSFPKFCLTAFRRLLSGLSGGFCIKFSDYRAVWIIWIFR